MDTTLVRPQVSIIVPVYNVEKYLTACLDSIIEQTFSNIEIIVVNDGSTDNSQSIIDAYAQKDARIVPLKKINGGLSSARNEGMKHVRGEYVFFVDSDDLIEPHAIQVLLEHAQKNDLEVVCCLTKLIDADEEAEEFDPYFNEPHLKPHVSRDGFTYRDVLESLFYMQVTAWNKLYKWELIERTQARFPQGLHFEDNPFFAQIMIHAKKIGFIEQKLNIYRVNRKGSIIKSKKSRLYFEYFDIMGLCEEIVHKSGKWDELKNSFTNYKFESIYHWYTQIHPELRQEYYEKMKSTFAVYASGHSDEDGLSEQNAELLKKIMSDEAVVTDEMKTPESQAQEWSENTCFCPLRKMGLVLKSWFKKK